MRIGVIGSGALGLYYGALLQRAGHDLHFLLRRDFKAISHTGLNITSPQGERLKDLLESGEGRSLQPEE